MASPSITRHAEDRFAWVDFAKGFCIIAVVTLWVTHEFEHLHIEQQITWLQRFAWFAYPFRMPDFFLISGLFLSRVIDRPLRSYLDTKVMHYLYFFMLWTLILVPAVWLFRGDVPGTAVEAAQRLASSLLGEPFAMLWFIMFLSIYFIAARLLRRVPRWVVFPLAVALMLFPLQTGQYHVDRFGVYFVYFYAGHAFAGGFFAIARWARAHAVAATVMLVVWAVANKLAVQNGWADHRLTLLPMAFIGISAVVMLSSLLSGLRAFRWVNYLGKNSIGVYLTFYLPMVSIVGGLLAAGWGDRLNVVGTAALVGSIGISVLVFELANRCGAGFLYNRPAWARLTPPRRSNTTAAKLPSAAVAASNGTPNR